MSRPAETMTVCQMPWTAVVSPCTRSISAPGGMVLEEPARLAQDMSQHIHLHGRGDADRNKGEERARHDGGDRAQDEKAEDGKAHPEDFPPTIGAEDAVEQRFDHPREQAERAAFHRHDDEGRDHQPQMRAQIALPQPAEQGARGIGGVAIPCPVDCMGLLRFGQAAKPLAAGPMGARD